MLEVLNILNADVTNGNKNYCMISEEQLNAIKKLAKIEDKEKNILQQRIDKALTLLKAFGGGEIIINDIIEILQGEEAKDNE